MILNRDVKVRSKRNKLILPASVNINSVNSVLCAGASLLFQSYSKHFIIAESSYYDHHTAYSTPIRALCPTRDGQDSKNDVNYPSTLFPHFATCTRELPYNITVQKLNSTGEAQGEKTNPTAQSFPFRPSELHPMNRSSREVCQ